MLPIFLSMNSKRLWANINILILVLHQTQAVNTATNISTSIDKIKIVGISNGVPESTVCINGSDLSKNQSNSILNNSYSVLYDYLNGTGAHNFSGSVTIGFLGAYRQAQVVLGALPLAVAAVNEDKGKD